MRRPDPIRALRERDLVVELRLALKMALGGTVAWWLAVELGARRPIFAALVPLVAMTGDPFAAVSVSFARILGVFAGVGLGIGFVHLDAGSTVRIALALVVASVVAMALRVGERPNLEVPIAALFMIGFATANVSQLGVQRIWETGVGAVVAILVSSLLWPTDPVRELTRRLERLRRALVADLAAVADDLATGERTMRLDDVREHSLDAVRDVFALEGAQRALRWSPLRRRDTVAVEALSARIHLAARVYRHARAVARDVLDTTVRDQGLAGATRDLADAVDRALAGASSDEPLGRAAVALDAPVEGEPAVVAAQLRQLLADLGAMRQDG